MLIGALKNNYIKILILILVSLIVDNLFILNINNPPAWDQGYHLSNVFKMYNILENNNFGFRDKIDQILNITDNYRGPITYFFSSIFLKIFKNSSYHYAYLSNQVFNLICIFSIFNIAKLIKNESTGIWASIIFTFSNFIVNQRSDYLIDLSLTSFSTLSLLFLTKWYINNKNNIKYSVLSGLALALVFLTKPTGIVLFILPVLFIILKTFKNKNDFKFRIFEILIFLFTFIVVIFPWFSKHWITIITSIINAWNWGINYQDGYEMNSIQSWLFYFKELPSIFGVINFSIVSTIFIFERVVEKNFYIPRICNLKEINFFHLLYLFNCYLIVSLMSTKDLRFILPIYPLLCIYLSLYINKKASKIFSIKSKKIILILSISISLFLSNNGLISKLINKKSYKWPQEEIIKTIKNTNVNLTSTLAVLPDIKELNTFNLESEAARQGEYVSARQIISNETTYKNDLEYFDWFLVKNGDQGIMTNKSKNLLNKYLLKNSSFVIAKKWLLPDKSQVFLLRRKLINSNLVARNCNFGSPSLKIKQIENGININLIGTGKLIKSSNLLIDFMSEDYKKFENLSLANGSFHPNFNQESCYVLSQNISTNLPRSNKKDLFLKVKLINERGGIEKINLKENFNIEEELSNDNYIKMTNRISKVELLGSYLQKGQFKNLFDLVGIINQSDPKQVYLKDSEEIYLQRYKDSNDLKSLYNILISQILQRKINEASQTINLILNSDGDNGNAHLVRSIINIYLFDKKNARISIDKAKFFETSNESSEIINTIEGLTYLLEMKFINAYKTFTL